MSDTYLVTGMTCEGCVRAVTNAIQRAVPGTAIEVELDTGRVTVDGADGEQAIAQAVDDAGFGFEGRAAD